MIAARIGIVADIAFALHVPIGQKTLRGLRVKHLLRFAIEIAVLQERQEHILRHFEVILRMRAGKQIERDAQLHKQLQEVFMITFIHGQRRGVLGVGAHRDGRAVPIGAGHH